MQLRRVTPEWQAFGQREMEPSGRRGHVRAGMAGAPRRGQLSRLDHDSLRATGLDDQDESVAVEKWNSSAIRRVYCLSLLDVDLA
jgi:hypothetical protein